MRHAATALSLCIALVSGIVFALLWGQPPLRSSSIQAESSSDVEETVFAFYRAVDAYLVDGEDAGLRKMLHPGFIDHAAGSAAGGNAADFLQQLDSVRRFFPGMRLTPEVVYLGNSTASVSLTSSDWQRSEFAGIGIDPADVLGHLDFVRVERRLIAERWSSAPLAGEFESFPAVTLELPIALDTLIARVKQISIDGSPEPAIDRFRHRLLIVQSGEALLEVMEPATIPVAYWQLDHGDVAGPATVEQGAIVTLGTMEAVLLPAGTRFRLWADDGERPTLLALEFGPPVSDGDSPLIPRFGDEANEALWSGVPLSGVGKRLTLAFGAATLFPEAALSSRQIEGMELIWVSGGAIDMTASSEVARVRDANGTRSQLDGDHALLRPGDTGAAGSGADIDYRVTGSTAATAWFFSLVPDRTSERDAGAPAWTPTPPPPRTAS